LVLLKSALARIQSISQHHISVAAGCPFADHMDLGNNFRKQPYSP
jgi:hypothetical protein